MKTMLRRRHTDVILEVLPLAGRKVLEVGCGDGALVRFMTRQRAEVVGLECSRASLARARTAEPAFREVYVVGRGEALPFAAAAFDIVVCFNSLHHVPVAGQRAALDEAARVLRPGGALYVMEPLAEGDYFALIRPVEDETEVRVAAYAALRAAADGADLSEVTELTYAAPVRHEGFETFRRAVLAANPDRGPAFGAIEDRLKAEFEALAQQRDGAYWFYQPSRLNLLRRL